MMIFLDLKDAFDSVDRTSLFSTLHRKGMPQKFVNLMRSLYSHTSGRVTVYGELSGRFETTISVRQGCPLSPFLFNFVMDKIMESALQNLQDVGVELGNSGKLCDLDYADDVICLFECTEHAQRALDRLGRAVAPFGMRFAPSKCKVMLQVWKSMIPSLMLDGKVLAIVDRLTYFSSGVTARGNTVVKVSTRILEARVAYAGLKHLWRRSDISLNSKGRVYCAAVCSVLLYGCETWSLCVEDIRRLEVFNH